MKPELLAPAGDLEKLRVALAYGADAVYLGGRALSMRANAKNFSPEEMAEGIAHAHALGKKVYIAVNIFAHNADFTGIAEYLISLEKMGADALIVSDAGIFTLAKAIVPDLALHISTQANVTNFAAAAFWHGAGAARVILARELTLREIRDINRKVPALPLECFVHGAMCMAYSGRCLISNYIGSLGGKNADEKRVPSPHTPPPRDANGGDCIQPCRWEYTPELTLREKKSGEPVHLREDTAGTYIFNARDLCMVRYIPDLVYAGVQSLKIEGRMKTAYYVAAATRTYREAIDDHHHDPELYESKLDHYTSALLRATRNPNENPFSTGFYFGKPTAADHSYTGENRFSPQDFLAIVESYDPRTGLARVEQRNKFSVGDRIEIFRAPAKAFAAGTLRPREDTVQVINELYDENKTPIPAAPHPKQKVYVKLNTPVQPLDILRKYEGEA